jgi:ribosome-binding protein aMBF1 (putative translation factor)
MCSVKNNSWASSIAERREALGWSRYRLAKRTGVRAETIARLEDGTHQPMPLTREAIERALATGEQERA